MSYKCCGFHLRGTLHLFRITASLYSPSHVKHVLTKLCYNITVGSANLLVVAAPCVNTNKTILIVAMV